MSIMQRQLINNTVDILLTENQTSIGFFTFHQMSLQCVILDMESCEMP